MPDPNPQPPVPTNLIATLIRSTYATCPPEDERSREDVENGSGSERLPIAGVREGSFEDSASNSFEEDRSSIMAGSPPAQSDNSDSEMRQDSPGLSSPMEEAKGETSRSTLSGYFPPAENIDNTKLDDSTRLHFLPLPKYTPCFLRHGSKFVGMQRSENQKYNVQVEIKHVNMAESTICGYLRIEGLTTDHPTLTTFFEGEMIGTKYTFQTRHPEWGSNEKVDMQHWNQFPEWRPLARAARRADFSLKNFAERENIFMRWKERFLVPDHSVLTINGASFEGFYYICFNQLTGNIDGIYFHHKSEKFQQLKLKHVNDKGCFGAVEFR